MHTKNRTFWRWFLYGTMQDEVRWTSKTPEQSDKAVAFRQRGTLRTPSRQYSAHCRTVEFSLQKAEEDTLLLRCLIKMRRFQMQ